MFGSKFATHVMRLTRSFKILVRISQGLYKNLTRSYARTLYSLSKNLQRS